MGRYYQATEIVTYPHGAERERVWRYDPDADPTCARCEDRGRWIGPRGTVEPCPTCQPERTP